MDNFEIYVHGKLCVSDNNELVIMNRYFALRQRFGDSNVKMRIVQIDNMKRW